MWLLFALGSAFFAGITAVLAKLGIHGHDSTLVTALRTSVVFLGAWIVAAISIKGHFASELTAITPRTYLFLFLSGLATGDQKAPRPRGCATTERSRKAPRPSLSLSTSFLYW